MKYLEELAYWKQKSTMSHTCREYKMDNLKAFGPLFME